MSDSAALAVGTRFVERFEIASVLAMGRRGTTYAAHDVGGGGAVALLHVLTMMTERQRRGYDDLASRLVSVQHPGLVPLVASGVVEHRPWFASRLVAGISVEEALRTHGTFPMRRAAELVCQAARALAVAHAAGILHRSLKPSNLLLVDGAASEVVVVLDLGIGAILCSDGRSVATPQFCAPEESSGLGVDARTDVYALGAVLFQMLTGRAPFEAPTAAALVEAHRIQPPPRLRALKASAEPLEAIVNRALAKRPADRFATMQDFAAAIEEVLAAPAVPLAVDSSDPAPDVAPAASTSPSTWHVVDAKEARTLAATNLALPTPLETVALSSAAPAAPPVPPVDSAPLATRRRARRRRELWFVVGLTLLATAFGVGLGMWWAAQ